jgi:hypothetical protein
MSIPLSITFQILLFWLISLMAVITIQVMANKDLELRKKKKKR